MSNNIAINLVANEKTNPSLNNFDPIPGQEYMIEKEIRWKAGTKNEHIRLKLVATDKSVTKAHTVNATEFAKAVPENMIGEDKIMYPKKKEKDTMIFNFGPTFHLVRDPNGTIVVGKGEKKKKKGKKK